jgi:pyruvate formate lyase activating enzyme
MMEARFWKSLKDGTVQCELCHHYCSIRPGLPGKCGVRGNLDGTLFALNYGKIAAMGLDPVEKKPLYHFQPGSRTYSFASMGCNLRCSFCQNWTLSQPPRETGTIEGRSMTPEYIVEEALRAKASSISYTYSEPTVFFEFMQDTAQFAREAGLKNIIVSNGYMSRECLDALGPLIDAANIDLKAFSDSFYRDLTDARLRPVLDNLRTIKHELGWWLEVTTLLIPGENESTKELEELTDFLVNELGPEVPWHISRFHPNYQMTDRARTESSVLQAAFDIGKSKGLHYVYIGNMPGFDKQDTYCPGCGAMVINRDGFTAGRPLVKSGRCEVCGEAIHGVEMG